jgi:hypothetical protein
VERKGVKLSPTSGIGLDRGQNYLAPIFFVLNLVKVLWGEGIRTIVRIHQQPEVGRKKRAEKYLERKILDSSSNQHSYLGVGNFN